MQADIWVDGTYFVMEFEDVDHYESFCKHVYNEMGYYDAQFIVPYKKVKIKLSSVSVIGELKR